jgi:deoxyribodipyrimidine photo-lyase
MSKSPVILLFRQDLRLNDHPALEAALATGSPLIPLYIHDTTSLYPLGGASLWWLHHSLESLQKSLQLRESNLFLKEGNPLEILHDLCLRHHVTHVFWSRRYAPHEIVSDKKLKESLRQKGVTVQSFNSHLLFEPWTCQTTQGKPFQVFTPFWKHCCFKMPPPSPCLATPTKIPTQSIESETLSDWKLLPTAPDWAEGFRQSWQPGERAAQDLLSNFMNSALKGYKENRNRPDLRSTSRLSPHLRFGEISVRQLWHQVHHFMHHKPEYEAGAVTFLSEIGWREFSYHLLFHFPNLPTTPLREQFKAFPWKEEKNMLKAWQKGLTGYPIVDAGMRELWQTGWMHNRVRMITASFLTKDLLISWQQGESWFWDTLVDADLANNAASWQWVAGCGTDASPYFRIFNPVLQGEKFDPDGTYVRRWVPELAKLPNHLIHKPWEGTTFDLEKANIKLGMTYPHRLVDHDQARVQALEIYQTLKRN